MINRLGSVGVIVAARTGSKRLPGKVLMPLGGQPMILFLLHRLSSSQYASAIVLATTDQPSDDVLANIVSNAGYPVFRGSEENLVNRYINAAAHYGFDYVVRVTGDCPLVDAESLDFCLKQTFLDTKFDLASTKGNFPIGIDYEIYSASKMIELEMSEIFTSEEREHLTLHFYNHADKYTILQLQPRVDWSSGGTYTVDTLCDYFKILQIVESLECNNFSISDLMNVNL
jgi:spore coat polysaccharide biosynthesis protein SpsF